jgi:HprK-related kinase A
VITTRKNETPAAFRIGELDVVVRSDLRGVLDDFAAMYPGCARRDPGARDAIRMEIKRDGRTRFGRRRYAVHGDGEKIHEHLHPDEVLPHLEWGLSWRIVARCHNYLQLHAASMAHEGKGVVLAGDSGAGKSTLAAALLARGWKYFCDEFALVDATTLKLHPYPKAVCIKAGSFDVIERLGLRLARGRHYIKALKGKVGYVSPADVGTDNIAEPCPARYVIFPSYSGAEKSRLYPVSKARAAFALLKTALNRDVFGERAVPIVGGVVRGARCLGLETGPIEETCDRLERLVR